MLDASFSEDDYRFLNENAHKTMNDLQKFDLAVHKNLVASSVKKSSIKTSTLSALLDINRLLDPFYFL